jgi:hypothetical protein
MAIPCDVYDVMVVDEDADACMIEANLPASTMQSTSARASDVDGPKTSDASPPAGPERQFSALIAERIALSRASSV